ncbi:MAG: 2-phospho-L-lactate transferase CofD family protein, partial [Actinomycetota bacterium]
MSLGSVVAIGGGHGLSMVLEALVDECDLLTAVVSVADDGGSSGRLRRDLD